MSAAGRYSVEQLPSEGTTPGAWAIRDSKTANLVSQPGEDGRLQRVTYPLRDLATAWIRRESYLQEAGHGRA